MRSLFCNGLGIAAAATLAVFAFDGSGSGKPVTPYKQAFPATAANIQKLRDASRNNRWFQKLRTAQSDTAKSGASLAFAIVKNGKWDKTLDALGGVDVAEIESFKLVERRGDKLVLEVKQFPSISAEELAAKKPTYTALRAGYAKTTRVEVDGNLGLLGKEWYDDPKHTLLCLARDLKPNEPVELMAERTRFAPSQQGPWWAIPSVTEDKEYPHRLITLK